MRKQAERVDEYVAKILNSLDAPVDVRTSTMGAFLPVAPEYTEPLLELVSRLAAEAVAIARLPRQMDAMLFERVVRRRDLTPEVRARLAITPAAERHIHLIAAFLREQFGLPAPVDKALTTALPARGTEIEADGEATYSKSTGASEEVASRSVEGTS